MLTVIVVGFFGLKNRCFAHAHSICDGIHDIRMCLTSIANCVRITIPVGNDGM